jgi:peptidoglycan/LPS O-acetylase OafA/YrhL
VLLELAQFGYHAFIKPVPDGITAGGTALVVSFLAGISLYMFKAKVPWSKVLCLAAFALSVVLALHHSTTYLVAFPASYVTVYLGLTMPKRIGLFLSGDYSYGLYLYGFPVQQAVSALFPEYRHWWFNLIVALPVTAVIAVGSWWLVENPTNKRRKVVYKVEAWVLERFGSLPFLKKANAAA